MYIVAFLYYLFLLGVQIILRTENIWYGQLCTEFFPVRKIFGTDICVRNFFPYGKYLVRTALHTNEQTNGMQLYVYRCLGMTRIKR